ncbi:S8 family serine peptidase [Winogradskya humida]|uniref:Type VII secretion-associated serine protease n=1 Tax=Winogradskya humida TaxID=113566 RepID=A0ABQ3ZQF1_9ACTN|nr:S8 family serine peptidase [Actinoplanes humidus]GIE20723.1 type VII secretion-associated serine protease [Actinoplanes humidus]
MFSRSLPAALAALVLATVLPASPALAGPRDQQWYLDALNVPAAQQLSRGAGVTIGVLTNGVPAEHPDLAGQVLPLMRLKIASHKSMIPVAADWPVQDPVSTGEIGLLVARGGTGLLGVAPEAKVQPVMCSSLPKDLDFCMHWMVDSGVDVIDLGSTSMLAIGTDFRTFDGFRYALAHNVVVVMSLKDGTQIPAADRAGVILAGGLDKTGKLPDGITPEAGVTVRAPAGDPVWSPPASQVLTLDPTATGGYGKQLLLGSDRIAAALVAGVVALVRAKDPSLNAPTVIDRVVRNTTDLGDPGPDFTNGYGLVNAVLAVGTTGAVLTDNPLGNPGPPTPGLYAARLSHAGDGR